MENILKMAENLGFSQAVPLENLALESRQELRSYCDSCPNHGSNWVCPPASGTLEACQDRLRSFGRGILLRSVTELTPPVAMETYGELTREHNLRFRQLVESVRPDVSELLPLTTGGCVFCESCAYPSPCIHPDVKMESLSAYGIDVGALSQMAGLPYAFREDRLYLTALLLLK